MLYLMFIQCSAMHEEGVKMINKIEPVRGARQIATTYSYLKHGLVTYIIKAFSSSQVRTKYMILAVKSKLHEQSKYHIS